KAQTTKRTGLSVNRNDLKSGCFASDSDSRPDEQFHERQPVGTAVLARAATQTTTHRPDQSISVDDGCFAGTNEHLDFYPAGLDFSTTKPAGQYCDWTCWQSVSHDLGDSTTPQSGTVCHQLWSTDPFNPAAACPAGHSCDCRHSFI